MGRVYSGIAGLNVPEFKAGEEYDSYQKRCDDYVKAVIEAAKAASPDPEAGEEITFPVADGYARYVVVALKPVQLVHLDVGDGWHYQYINRLTAADIRKCIANKKALAVIFDKQATR